MALEVTIGEVDNLSEVYNDVLQVQGDIHDPSRDTVDDDGNPVEFVKSVTARGWVSAETHFYPPEDYDENGNIVPGSTPREMTDDEKNTYVTNLLIAEFNQDYPATN